MPIHQLSTDELIVHVERLVSVASADGPLQEAVAGRGYDTEELERGQALVEALQQAGRTYNRHVAARKAATDAVRRHRSALVRTFAVHRQICRRELGADARAVHLLLLDRPVPARRDELVLMVREFYAALDSDDALLDAVADRGLSRTEVQSAETTLEALTGAIKDQHIADSTAQDAASARRRARQAVLTWASDFHFYAQEALADRPQLLEQIGRVVPSE